jgi:hypothetical protein
MKVWIHKDLTTGELLDGRGFPVRLGDVQAGPNTIRKPSEKLTIWADRAALDKQIKKESKGKVVRDLGNRVEIDYPADHLPARTLAYFEVEL